MHNFRKSISVCIATFNGEQFIGEQISSIIPQLGLLDEIVISDNGSSDNTIDVIRQFNDSRIKIYHYSEPNVIKNFENAISKAKNDVIVLCDQDDVWLHNRIDSVIREHQHYDLVTVRYRITDARLEFLSEQNRLPVSSFWATILKNGYIGCGMSFNKSIIKDILPFPRSAAMHDWWIALLCLTKYKVLNTDEVLFLYRRHGNNVSFTSEKSKFSIFEKIKMRFKILFLIFLRLLKIR
ncbi:glycosyltransferase [Vibrio fluvialis]|uniref:glycosyltransferase n=1 Tax=Vibrio fluvialis TaxID=676 RepID=UPI000648423A|nr:glycosyltransferase [Vibrio fluvialis]MBY7796426.1 glycosyltransferase [Vibrio fluvialis]MBY7839016.1 glycosyltransferase [Vibrio fluvialis]MBY8023003.1 glycosyltransferase [Vibrio fluvialis]MBY8057477.1 glycosyltransferase [Vibrio fluvialis]MBY8279451.1 glycosyltransferase [Vibrio fluvialis]